MPASLSEELKRITEVIKKIQRASARVLQPGAKPTGGKLSEAEEAAEKVKLMERVHALRPEEVERGIKDLREKIREVFAPDVIVDDLKKVSAEDIESLKTALENHKKQEAEKPPEESPAIENAGEAAAG